MARAASTYVCQACGAVYPRWQGRCDACGEWNQITEEAAPEAPPKGLGRAGGRSKRLELVGLDAVGPDLPRRSTGIAELDRVLGGGLVPGSAVLIGGDPGIGKSTLLLQAAARMAALGAGAVYVSGEEAVDQIRMRAHRLGLGQAPVRLAAATDVRAILSVLDTPDAPALVVVDSIQTMYLDTLESAPGTVTQVRGASAELIRAAKRRGSALVLVGHVTKDGAIAGPRVLEHMVDAVLYFEGERGHQFRILRGVKNRFGATDEIGVFEMTDAGLSEVENPSDLFLAERDRDVSGSVVFAGMEGTRPVLVELQALVAPSPLGTPRRAVVGWDGARLAMVLAVLEARCGVQIGANDVYLNVAGGLRITEPAADLAVAAALVSSLTGAPLPPDTVLFGEIGLSGEIRPVSHTEARLREAAKLGFQQAILPRRRVGRQKKGAPAAPDGLRLTPTGHLDELVGLLAARSDATGERWIPRTGP